MGSLVGDGFRFGVATAGFQIEGGFNGTSEPKNNWYEWEEEGRIEPSGIALDFWNRYPEQLDKAADLGIDSFRLSIEWARCEPSEDSFDDAAFDGYLDILGACHARGMEPLVTLAHFTHPAWLGVDFWSRSDSPERFACWAAEAVRRLSPKCHNWVTLNEINILALMTWFLGAFPPGRRLDGRATLRATDHLLAAHVLAYGRIKAVQPEAVVSTNNFCFSVYELDRLTTDLLQARVHGVERQDLGRWVKDRRSDWYAGAPGQGIPGPSRSTRRWPAGENGLRQIGSLIDPEKAFPRALAAIYGAEHDRSLDVTQIDFYDPETASHIQRPLMRTSGGRWPFPQRPLWDDPPNPAGLRAYCEANVEPGADLWIVENGLCNRVRRGHSYERLDGWDRPRYLRENLEAVIAAIGAGVPISGYWHWCLADNYEWGSYEPRFGLYGIDRERGCKWNSYDSMGDDAAGAYRRLIEGIRSGDASVLAGSGAPVD